MAAAGLRRGLHAQGSRDLLGPHWLSESSVGSLSFGFPRLLALGSVRCVDPVEERCIFTSRGGDSDTRGERLCQGELLWGSLMSHFFSAPLAITFLAPGMIECSIGVTLVASGSFADRAATCPVGTVV